MTITEIVKLIADNSVTIIVIAYFLWKDYAVTKNTKDNYIETLQTVNNSLTKLNDTVELLKDLLLKGVNTNGN